MSQWRARGPPVSARDAVLARIRLALPRTPEEQAAADGRRWRRGSTPTRAT